MNNIQDRAREALRNVLSSPSSDFYRHKYENDPRVKVAASGGEWSMVPFLTRDEIQRVPLWSRIFSPDKRKVNAIRPTSGTSGKGVLLMPRTTDEKNAKQWQHSFYTALPIRRVASFSGAQFLYTYSNTERIDTLQLVPGDIALSAALVERYQPDVLAGFPYALVALAPLLHPKTTGRIQVIQLFGELCTESDWRFLKTYFPHSVFSAEYSSIEAQTPVAVTCATAGHSHELLVHPITDTTYVELIDASGNPVTEVGKSGEIVLTVLRPTALPLIRYKTGDSARIVRTDCSCGATTPLLQIEGRVEIDRLRIRGGEIHTVEMDRVLSSLSQYLAGYEFEVRVAELMQGGLLVPSVTVVCMLQPHIAPEDMARLIALALRVAPDKTYAQGVAAGEYAPLKVLQRQGAPGVQGKRVRIVRE